MIEWLAGWYNWPFLFPLAIGVLFILIDLTIGSISEMLGIDGSFDVNGDGIPDINVDVDGDLDGGIDADGDGHGFHPGQWLGMGKVPLSILIEVFCITWGLTGLIVNGIANDIIPGSWGSPLAFLPALFAAFVVAPFATRTIAGWINHFAPQDSTTSKRPQDFVGQTGTAASVITPFIGQVTLPASGTLPETTLPARHASGDADLPRGCQVIIIGYEANRRIYNVEPLPIPNSQE